MNPFPLPYNVSRPIIISSTSTLKHLQSLIKAKEPSPELLTPRFLKISLFASCGSLSSSLPCSPDAGDRR
jgi:hypothetical protein